jgi:hypothetical protein
MDINATDLISRKDAKVFRVRTNQTLKSPAIPAPLRKKKIKSRRGAEPAEVFGVITNQTPKFFASFAPLRE